MNRGDFLARIRRLERRLPSRRLDADTMALRAFLDAPDDADMLAVLLGCEPSPIRDAMLESEREYRRRLADA